MSSFNGISSQPIRKPKPQSSITVPDGTFSWATVHQYSATDLGQLKAACVHGDVLYTSGRRGINTINCVTGLYEEFQQAEQAQQQLVHTMCVVAPPSTGLPAWPGMGPAQAAAAAGNDQAVLWTCTGNGSAFVYRIADGSLLRKAVVAHTGEVTAIAAAPAGNYVVTGGADFQVKSWNPSGDLLSASGHHHTAIQCLALVPILQQQHRQSAGAPAATAGGLTSRRTSTAGDRRVSSAGSRVQSAGSNGSSDSRCGSSGSSSIGPCKVWVGAADGSLSVCSDVNGSGTLDPASWRILRVDGLQARPSATCAACVHV